MTGGLGLFGAGEGDGGLEGLHGQAPIVWGGLGKVGSVIGLARENSSMTNELSRAQLTHATVFSRPSSQGRQTEPRRQQLSTHCRSSAAEHHLSRPAFLEAIHDYPGSDDDGEHAGM